MYEKTKNIILTRFNLAIEFGCEKRDDSIIPIKKPWLDEEYLNKRFEIFENYTFVSLKNQTDQEFDWIVMFHKDTPEEYKLRIKKFETEMVQFHPVFFDDSECKNWEAVLTNIIKNKALEGTGVITTRIDNDDAVHATFVQSIKQNLKNVENNTVLSFTNGLQYELKSKDVLNYECVNNHFLSMYDNEGEGKHILLYNHYFIEKEKAVTIKAICTEIPLWIEVITQNNYSNNMRWRFGSIKVDYRIQKEFPQIRVKWESKCEYWKQICLNIIKVIFFRGKGIEKVLYKKIILNNK